MLQDTTVLDSRYEVQLSTEKERKDGWYKSKKIFSGLQGLLRKAALETNLSCKEMFTMSVTEEEIANGVLKNERRDEQSLCIVRSIKGIEQHPPDDISNIDKWKFIDMVDSQVVDISASKGLARLQRELDSKLGKNNKLVVEVGVGDVGNALHDPTMVKYMRNLMDGVCKWLWEHIECGFSAKKATTPLFDEVVLHLEFVQEKLRGYIPRDDIQGRILEFLLMKKPTNQQQQQLAMVLKGRSGVGKTALVAWAADWVSQNVKGACMVVRFLGTTPHSSDVILLLKSICHQLIEFLKAASVTIPFETDELLISGTHMKLSELMKELMELVSRNEMTVFLFLDSLDQLLSTNHAHSLHWLPLTTPPGVKLLVSTLFGGRSLLIYDQLEKLFESITTNVVWKLIVPPITPNLAKKVLDCWFEKPLPTRKPGELSRLITSTQRKTILEKFEQHPTPLLLRVAADIAFSWPSYSEDANLEVYFIAILTYGRVTYYIVVIFFFFET